MSLPLPECSDERPPPMVPAGSGRAVISATMTAAPIAEELRALRGRARYLEVRADLTGDIDPRWLRQHFGGELLYSLRSEQDGGAFAGPPAERATRLRAAAADYDLVDLEADRDLTPDLLATIPPDRRRISWHGPAAGVDQLRQHLARMLTTPARLYLVASAITSAEQALAPLMLLKQCGRSDVTAFGTGQAGTWSRLLAPWFGAPVIYGRLGAVEDSGVPTVDQLVGDYGFPHLRQPHTLYGIVGRSVLRSVSPRLHNAGFRELDLSALYLPFQVEDFAPFWSEVVEHGLTALGLPLRGATVVSPHKEAALAIADEVSPAARQSGSANSLVRTGRSWRADTSNSPAVVEALARAEVRLAGRRVAVIGCGGAGRAAAVALRDAGAEPVLVNRGLTRGRYAAELLNMPFVPLADFCPRGFPVVIHATPLATQPLFDVEELTEGAAVLDMVYAPEDTAIVSAARARGLTVVDGWDVLLADASCQFRLMTGRQMPIPQTRALLAAARNARRQPSASTASGTTRR